MINDLKRQRTAHAENLDSLEQGFAKKFVLDVRTHQF